MINNFKIHNCKRAWVGLIIFTLSSWAGLAQTVSDSLETDTQLSVIEFPERITVQTFFINTYNTYRFGDRFSDLSFELRPNKQDRLGLSAAYGILAFSFSFAPDFLGDNRDNDNSKLFNLNLAAFPGKWMQAIDIYYEKGYYINQGSRGGYLPDTKSLKVGGRTAYIMNERFSMKAILNQDEKQLKSAGSLIPGLTYYYSEFDFRGEGSEGPVRETYYSFDIALTPAYYYNFVPVRNLMFSVGGSAGLGMNISSATGERLTSLLTELSYSAGIVWDTDSFYLGGRYRHLSLNHNSDRVTQTVDQIPTFTMFFGYRFKAPRFLSSTYKKVLGGS